MRFRPFLAVLLAFAIASLPFGMTSMMQVRHSAMAATQQGMHGAESGLHARHAAMAALHPGDNRHSGRNSADAPFAHCAAAQMLPPAEDGPGMRMATASVPHFDCVTQLTGQFGDPFTPPPRA